MLCYVIRQSVSDRARDQLHRGGEWTVGSVAGAGASSQGGRYDKQLKFGGLGRRGDSRKCEEEAAARETYLDL